MPLPVTRCTRGDSSWKGTSGWHIMDEREGERTNIWMQTRNWICDSRKIKELFLSLSRARVRAQNAGILPPYITDRANQRIRIDKRVCLVECTRALSVDIRRISVIHIAPGVIEYRERMHDASHTWARLFPSSFFPFLFIYSILRPLPPKRIRRNFMVLWSVALWSSWLVQDTVVRQPSCAYKHTHSTRSIYFYYWNICGNKRLHFPSLLTVFHFGI